MSARSRTPAWRTSCSTLKAYSNAAPSQVQVPCPMPMTSTWCSPCFILAIEASSAADAATRRAHRIGVTVGAQPRGGAEIELGAGGVDQVVIGQLPMLTGAGGAGIGHLDVGRVVRRVALGVDGGGQGLLVADALALVDRSELEGHLVGLHLADTDPDVRRDPVPVGVGGDHHDLVGPREFPGEMERR